MKTIVEYLLSKSKNKALCIDIPDDLNELSIEFMKNNADFFEKHVDFFGHCRMYDIRLDSYCNLFLSFDHKCKKHDVGMTYYGVSVVIKLKSGNDVPISVEFRVATKMGREHPAYGSGLDKIEPKSVEDALDYIETKINNIEYEKVH